ncbi:MAG: macrolide 2'-phosphotransferase [Actinomycetales bacterium]
MRRTPIELAAVASAAVPGLSPTAVAAEPDDSADFESAVLLDADRKRWRVRSPKHPEASTRLETELLVLRAFTPAVRAELPFLMPTVAGTVRQGELTTFVYAHLSGRPVPAEELAAAGKQMAKEVGAAMAAIHDLPPALVSAADLPSYTANEFRQRRLNELDQAATTGKIPSALLRRWEHALEDVALWKFSPCVVHGDLHEDNLLVEDGRVIAVTGWTDLRVGDPADDLAWLVALHDPSFVDTVEEAYAAARKEQPDRHLMRRAALSAEFALAQWLVKGVAAANTRMVAEAEEMLRTLEHDIAAYGGQPISTEPPSAPADAAAGSAASAPESGTPATTGTAQSQPAAGASDAAADGAGPASGPAVTVQAIPVADDVAAPDAAPADADQGAPAAADGVPVPDGSASASEATEPDATSPEDTEPSAASPENTDTTALKVIPL